MSAFLVGTSVGWILSLYGPSNQIYLYKFENKSFRLSFSSRKIFNLIFYCFFIIVMIHNIILVFYSSKFGYVDVIHSHKTDLNFPILLRIFELFYKLIGVLFIYYCVNKKEYIIKSILFLIPIWVLFFAGARGEAVASTIVIMLIYSHHFSNISFFRVALYLILIFLISVLTGTYRFMENKELTSILSNLLNESIFHINGNASSIAVLSYTIMLKDVFTNDLPFIFGYLDAVFSFAPNYTDQGIAEKNYLAQHLTYHLNPEKLYRGSTFGTSQIAEFYEFANGSIYLVGIFSIMFLFFANTFIKNIFNNPMFFYSGYTFLEFFILSPRGSVFKVFNKEFLICIIILAFLNLLIKRKN